MTFASVRTKPPRRDGLKYGYIAAAIYHRLDYARKNSMQPRRGRPPQDREQGGRSEHSTEGQPTLEELLLALPVPRPQRHRAYVRTPQGFSQNRNQIRPPRPQLSRRRLSRRHPLLLVMSPDPSHVNLKFA